MKGTGGEGEERKVELEVSIRIVCISPSNDAEYRVQSIPSILVLFVEFFPWIKEECLSFSLRSLLLICIHPCPRHSASRDPSKESYFSQEKPYVMVKEDKNLTGNARFEGFCIDLLKWIASQVGFQYAIRLVPDHMYGVYDPKTKEWNGIVRELMEKVKNLRNFIYLYSVTFESSIISFWNLWIWWSSWFIIFEWI